MSLYDVSFVDDAVVPVYGLPEALLGKLPRVASVCVDVFAEFGMTLNFKPGKSEAIVTLIGPGKKAAKCDLASNDHVMVFYDRNDTKHELRFLPVYRHVGTHRQPNVQMGKEISIRNAAMRSGSLRLRTKLFTKCSYS